MATFQLTTAGDRHGIPIIYHGFATIPAFSLPTPSFLGFTARTGGATNNHWVRAVSRETVCECSNGQPSFSTRSLTQPLLPTGTAPPPPLPGAPLPVELDTSAFTLAGDATLAGSAIQLTGVENSQQGTAFVNLGALEGQYPVQITRVIVASIWVAFFQECQQ